MLDCAQWYLHGCPGVKICGPSAPLARTVHVKLVMGLTESGPVPSKVSVAVEPSELRTSPLFVAWESQILLLSSVSN